jgi:hypothetical protein
MRGAIESVVGFDRRIRGVRIFETVEDGTKEGQRHLHSPSLTIDSGSIAVYVDLLRAYVDVGDCKRVVCAAAVAKINHVLGKLHCLKVSVRIFHTKTTVNRNQLYAMEYIITSAMLGEKGLSIVKRATRYTQTRRYHQGTIQMQRLEPVQYPTHSHT